MSSRIYINNNIDYLFFSENGLFRICFGVFDVFCIVNWCFEYDIRILCLFLYIYIWSWQNVFFEKCPRSVNNSCTEYFAFGGGICGPKWSPYTGLLPMESPVSGIGPIGDTGLWQRKQFLKYIYISKLPLARFRSRPGGERMFAKMICFSSGVAENMKNLQNC